MQLPNVDAAHVPKEKITEYLLRWGHEDAMSLDLAPQAFKEAPGEKLP